MQGTQQPIHQTKGMLMIFWCVEFEPNPPHLTIVIDKRRTPKRLHLPSFLGVGGWPARKCVFGWSSKAAHRVRHLHFSQIWYTHEHAPRIITILWLKTAEKKDFLAENHIRKKKVRNERRIRASCSAMHSKPKYAADPKYSISINLGGLQLSFFVHDVVLPPTWHF